MEKVATEEYEAARGGRPAMAFDDDAGGCDWRWRFDNAAEEAGLLFMVDGVVLICEIKGCGRSKVMMKDNSTPVGKQIL
jgi:hypothetical protein